MLRPCVCGLGMRLMLHYVLYLDPGTYLNRKEERFISLITDKKIGHDYLIRGIPQFPPSFPTTVYIRAIASTSP